MANVILALVLFQTDFKEWKYIKLKHSLIVWRQNPKLMVDKKLNTLIVNGKCTEGLKPNLYSLTILEIKTKSGVFTLNISSQQNIFYIYFNFIFYFIFYYYKVYFIHNIFTLTVFFSRIFLKLQRVTWLLHVFIDFIISNTCRFVIIKKNINQRRKNNRYFFYCR